ncbi:hypothetical protein GS3922_02125 [Geobacillus subterraneus]|uniref:YtzH-like protein n=2 Tax=Geobacillus TaxID=129337 RepID=A0ABN4NHZ5_9BACL|nr:MULTISPECIES: YtzH-like family protein [Geobacillus]AMX82565.1 hypothetical protein GS3922_02125 [Geobacillus subterraneus]KZS26982.1 hypothetical protein A5418_06475 [Geobacillus subterraneus]OXB90652.1 hypothetical protein B9L21_01910 [Geobacillus uzenensis]QIZ68713.1 hypothetical protein HF500_16655 [Geobacillus subterraneus]WPZ17738.1 YtzH-like family protein [Geobacillus subterraneus]
MPLDHSHQLTVLRDILSEHQLDCCGTVSECEQIERLVKSLLANDEVSTNVKQILPNIYAYGQGGKYSPDVNAHISAHQAQLADWVNELS